MKKLLAIDLAFVMVIGLVACGKAAGGEGETKAVSTIDAKVTGNAIQLDGGVLKDSDIDGNIQVTGESAMRGDINLADKSIVKVSGGKLTIEDGASLVGPAHSTDLPHVPKNFGVSLFAGQTNESWVEKDGLSTQGAGTVEVAGDVFAGQVHATADGKITVAATGSVVASVGVVSTASSVIGVVTEGISVASCTGLFTIIG